MLKMEGRGRGEKIRYSLLFWGFKKKQTVSGGLQFVIHDTSSSEEMEEGMVDLQMHT